MATGYLQGGMSMHLLRYSLAVLGMSCAVHTAHGQVIFQESFEGSNAYTVTNGGFDTASNGFFTTLPQSRLTLGYSLSSVDGGSYFGARNLDGFATATPHRITFSTQDVSAYQNLSLVVALSAPGGNRFEGNDAVTLEYSLDGGGHFTLLDHFVGRTGGGNLSNGLRELTAAFVDYSYAIPNGATQFAFRLTADNCSAADEAGAFDNVRILGDARAAVLAVAEPDTLWLGGLGLLGALRRCRRIDPGSPHRCFTPVSTRRYSRPAVRLLAAQPGLFILSHHLAHARLLIFHARRPRCGHCRR